MPKRKSIQAIFTLTFRDGVMVVVGVAVTILIGGLVVLNQPKSQVLTYQPKGVTAAWIPATVRHWDDTINEMSKRYDIDANVIAILMTMESGGDPQARSEAGAIGLMQITPPTAKDIAARYVKRPVTRYDLTDPKTSIEFGAAYLAMLRDQYGSKIQAPDYTRTVELIAAAYNGGFGAANALEDGEGLRDTQTVAYSRDAFNMWRERVAATSPTYDRWNQRGGSTLVDAAVKAQQVQ